MNLQEKTIEELNELKIATAEEINSAGKAKNIRLVNEKMAEWRKINAELKTR